MFTRNFVYRMLLVICGLTCLFYVQQLAIGLKRLSWLQQHHPEEEEDDHYISTIAISKKKISEKKSLDLTNLEKSLEEGDQGDEDADDSGGSSLDAKSFLKDLHDEENKWKAVGGGGAAEEGGKNEEKNLSQT